MQKYSVKMDSKWQHRWKETGLYKFNEDNVEEKFYCLEMFSYPSGAKLHIGHWYNYGLTDSWARIKKMQGYEVLEPMGFDAFGLPAENYAIKTGIHPYKSTMSNIETMRRQLSEMGAMFDWDYEVVTCEPNYYKWTQWLFLELYKNDLAYRAKSPVNWCTGCQTVLANEQVIDSICERCDSEVVKKDLTQWYFSITNYAEELLQDLDDLDWPEKTKAMQRNWIGKSSGAIIQFSVKDTNHVFTTFTTRADTLFGATYVVLAPEHDLVEQITTPEQAALVKDYQQYARRQSEIERLSTAKEKSGVFTGSYAIHPLTGEEMPIWIADYVLASYGTGAVMAVPGHDTRDHVFATKYDLPIVRVVTSSKQDVDDTLPFTEYGVSINSQQYNGLNSEEAKEQIVAKLAQLNKGHKTINYRLRDWSISRQRYWGAPIPVVHCDECGIVPVPESDLPVVLPHDVDYTPRGMAPLATNEEFINTTCPACGKPAKRDPNTLDTFVDSSWYFLRYPDNKNESEAWDKNWISKMLPVDKYVGGPEHACMHLLYARFITKAMRDLGHLDFDEPFKSLTHQGIILGPDGNRMSKSKGNVISPDPYIEEYGSDVLRLYLAFGFAYIEGGAWDENGIKATARFVERVERFIDNLLQVENKGQHNDKLGRAEKEVNYVRHYAIKGVTEDSERFQYNTCISRMMELTNALYKYDNDVKDKNIAFLRDCVRDLLLIMAPFAPHFTEEMWERLGYEYSIFNQAWPEFNPQALIKDVIELAIQVNGKVRGHIEVNADSTKEEVKELALASNDIQSYIEGKIVRKVIVVPKRLVNIVVG